MSQGRCIFLRVRKLAGSSSLLVKSSLPARTTRSLLSIFLLWLLLILLPALKSQNLIEPLSRSFSSNAIAVTDDGRLVLAVNPDSNSLSLLDTAVLTITAEIPVGIAPQSVALSWDNTFAYVANKDSDSVSLIDLGLRTVTAEISTGDRPVGVAVSPDGRFLAVAELGADRIRFFETDGLDMVVDLPVSDRPYGLAFTPDGRYLLVSHLLDGSVTVIPVRPYMAHLPVVPGDGMGQAGPNGQPPRSIATWPNVGPAPAVMVNGDGTRAYLPQTMANGLGLNTQFDTTVFPKVSVLNLESWTHQTSEHISLPETDQPVGLPWQAALAQNDSELWVVNAASNDVSVLDISNPAIPAQQAHLLVEDNPRGIVFSPDGTTAYVNNTLAGSVSVIDAVNYSVTAVIPTTNIPLPPLLLEGKRLFHSSAIPELAQAKWISCNTCHVEGEQDGRTWLLQFLGDIPPGGTPVITRNTTSLLGMIQTYPLRWSAEWDESADSEFSIRFEQFGTGLIVGDMHPTLGTPNQGRSAELDALAAFIDSLAIPERAHGLTTAELRGKAIFESPQTECALCHPAPLYTDLQQHDVGTADAAGEWFGPYIDTPTLRFLYDSGPYLHDGRADTLLDVLTIWNPTDAHGVTSHLTTQELADLAAYLAALPYSTGQD